MKQLIGLTGKKGSGKDTACEMLAEIVKPLCLQRIGFADEVYNDLANMLGRPAWWIKENKESFRLMLQGYATDYRRKMQGDDYWIDRWEEKFINSSADIVVVPDVRFINEAAYIQKMGGVVWRINRPAVLSQIDLHISENELDEFQFPTVDNSGSPQQMIEQLQKLYAVYSTQHPIAQG